MVLYIEMNLIILFYKTELSEAFDETCGLMHRNRSFCGVKCYRQKCYGLKNHPSLLVCIVKGQTQYKLMVIFWVEKSTSAVYRLSGQSAFSRSKVK
jgi:hypothetical protein